MQCNSMPVPFMYVNDKHKVTHLKTLLEEEHKCTSCAFLFSVNVDKCAIVDIQRCLTGHRRWWTCMVVLLLQPRLTFG